MNGLNPVPRWFPAFFFLGIAIAMLGAAIDGPPKSYAQDKKEEPKKEAPKTVTIPAEKIIVITMKGTKDFTIHSTLPVEALESRYLKTKNKVEVLKDGGVLVRGDGPPYILQDGGDSKILLMMGGVKVKYTEVRIPSGYFATFK